MTPDSESLVAQETFRMLLQAMSHPGRNYPLLREEKGKNPSPEEGLTMILRTLLDHEVSFCVIGADRREREASVSRLTGCPPAATDAADFLVVPGGTTNRSILRAKRGTLDYPDAGATVIYAVGSVEGADAFVASAVLKGPGIKDQIAVAISGLNPEELADIKEMTSEFPLGIDCIFVDRAGRVMCIPRSTRIEVR